MNRKQQSKRNFRKSRKWKDFRRLMYIRCGKIDAITGHRLHKGWSVHHRALDESKYEVLEEENFICLNNLTHKVIHWLWEYYQEDKGIIDRLKNEMEIMERINGK